jgi:hypothetical protein
MTELHMKHEFVISNSRFRRVLKTEELKDASFDNTKRYEYGNVEAYIPV